ncbi:MAG: transcription elongation factor GreA [Candidatus Azosocius agrarius]|nr:MAG: transcription elongation factor GreA [Gammaproteobacteria bacterium]
MNRVPMTDLSAKILKEELYVLKTQKRLEVINAISDSRLHGDLKENAEYHSAREQQGFIEGRIQEIEYKLINSNIIDVSKFKNEGKIIFGSIIDLLNVDTHEKMIYKIVGDEEADLKYRKVSISSPVAKFLIGKYKNEIIDVKIPVGIVTYNIIKVFYIS